MNENNQIKVLRIIGECKTGGTETIAFNYYKNLNHQKIKMDFLFYGDSIDRFDIELKKNGDKVINVVEYSKNMFKSIKQIKETVRNGKYDIVHAQLNALNFFPLLGAYLGGAKIRIASNHSTANLRYEFKKSCIKYLLRHTSGILATDYAACSKYAGEWAFGKKKSKKGQIKIIPNAINLDNFQFSQELREKVRDKENWNDNFVIGHVGRFVKQKNHMFIIDVFRKIHEKNDKAILILIGDGDLIEEVRKRVHEYKLDDYVKFFGIRFDVSDLMQGMDLFLFPSLYEGLGNVITEAQGVSLHAIASDVVPNEVKMTEYVEFLPLNNDAKMWADYALKYQDGYQKRNTYNDLVKAGYEIKSAAKRLEEYYMGLYQKHQNGGEKNENFSSNS